MSHNKDSWTGKEFNVNGRICHTVRMIAEGGYAVVLLVTCEDDRYALKRQCVNSPSSLSVVQNEITILKMLQNAKNVVRYVDSSVTTKEDVQEVLILMEYCDGEGVKEIINRRDETKFDAGEVLKIFLDVVVAVSELHHHDPPITHRDLKMDNILRNKGQFVLCDFGSATTKTIDTMGCCVSEVREELEKYTTPMYRSPEMVDLYSGMILSCKSDIWALGCLLYEMIYNKPPFSDSATAIQSGKVSFPNLQAVSEDLKSLIMFMLNPNPDERPYISEVASRVASLAGVTCVVGNEPNHSIVMKSRVLKNNVHQLNEENDCPKLKQEATSLITTSVSPRIRPKPEQDTKAIFPLNFSTQRRTISKQETVRNQNNILRTSKSLDVHKIIDPNK